MNDARKAPRTSSKRGRDPTNASDSVPSSQAARRSRSPDRTIPAGALRRGSAVPQAQAEGAKRVRSSENGSGRDASPPCSRCGHRNHGSPRCYARRHVNGSTLA